MENAASPPSQPSLNGKLGTHGGDCASFGEAHTVFARAAHSINDTNSSRKIHLLRRLLHTMSGTELSHARTELERLRILTTIPPHPLQANSQLPPHRYLGYAFVPTHRQVKVATSPLRIDSCCRLGGLHQQKAQQGIALLADVPQPLLASTGVLTRNHPHISADLLATRKPCRSPEHLSQGRKRTHTGMGHQSQRLRSLPGFPLGGCRQLCNRRIQTVQQLQQLWPASTGPGS